MVARDGADGGAGDRPGASRRTTLVIVGVCLLVACVIAGVAALGSIARTSRPSPEGSSEPGGVLTVVGGTDMEPFGLEPALLFTGLGITPADASAEITVTAGNGKSLSMFTVRPERASVGAGELVFRGTESLGQQIADLGPPPFDYSVTLTLEGTTYTGTGSWPADQVTDDEPAVGLDFDPPLPGQDG